jgi:DNA-binding response OmpR family regulator
LSLGADAYLVKPFEPARLQQLIRQFLPEEER